MVNGYIVMKIKLQLDIVEVDFKKIVVLMLYIHSNVVLSIIDFLVGQNAHLV